MANKKTKKEENLKEEKKKTERKVSPKKLRMRDKLVELIKNNNTFIISSIKGVPSSQLQQIRHKLKKVAGIMIVKKHVMRRAMDEAAKLPGETKLKDIEKYLEEGSAVLFSQLDPFELASILSDERTPAKAKAGQTALQDIKIEAGPTDIPAGPMISDLSNAGIKIAIESGKITIKKPEILVKKNEKISENIANILVKLEIMPFEVGLELIAAFDAKTHKTYIGIRIDKKATLEKLKQAFTDARALAVEINYPTQETITMIIVKAALQEKAIAALIKSEQPKEEAKAEEGDQKTEEKKEETEQKEEKKEVEQQNKEESKEENKQDNTQIQETQKKKEEK